MKKPHQWLLPPYKKRSVFLLIIFFIFLKTSWKYTISNGLVSDEEIVDHFYKNREKIETILKNYREFITPPGTSPTEAWMGQSNMAELMKKLNIDQVHEVGGLWFPNPYAQSTVDKINALYNQAYQVGHPIKTPEGFDISRYCSEIGFEFNIKPISKRIFAAWKELVFSDHPKD